MFRLIWSYLLMALVMAGLGFLMKERDIVSAATFAIPLSMVMPFAVLFNPKNYCDIYGVTKRQVRMACIVMIAVIVVGYFLWELLVLENPPLLSLIFCLIMPIVGSIFFSLGAWVERRYKERRESKG